MKILLIEDNSELTGNVQDFLHKEGVICEAVQTSFDAQDKLLAYEYDCVVLDIMLPDGSGLDILRFIKSQKISASVIIISAKDSLEDKITGLDWGADDYLTKPFYLSELYARLKALYRRNNLKGNDLLEVGSLQVDTCTLQVFAAGMLVDLTRKEFDLLVFLITNKNRVLSRQAIAQHLWGDYIDDLANFDFVYQHIKNLRKKITLTGNRDPIQTVYGIGYKFSDQYS
ncbi:response regulator transcription factor [Negadavirga shengliensis]|uniref:Response regulator transcription factor n=1 Tax=Negadavirga shengliensis TaxID=1389218 RepID=A0ABV9T2Y7_9BACT